MTDSEFQLLAEDILGVRAVTHRNPKATKWKFSCHAGLQEWNDVYRGKTAEECLAEAQRAISSQ